MFAFALSFEIHLRGNLYEVALFVGQLQRNQLWMVKAHYDLGLNISHQSSCPI
jgi:hypothetical protein